MIDRSCAKCFSFPPLQLAWYQFAKSDFVSFPSSGHNTRIWRDIPGENRAWRHNTNWGSSFEMMKMIVRPYKLSVSLHDNVRWPYREKYKEKSQLPLARPYDYYFFLPKSQKTLGRSSSVRRDECLLFLLPPTELNSALCRALSLSLCLHHQMKIVRIFTYTVLLLFVVVAQRIVRC